MKPDPDPTLARNRELAAHVSNLRKELRGIASALHDAQVEGKWSMVADAENRLHRALDSKAPVKGEQVFAVHDVGERDEESGGD